MKSVLPVLVLGLSFATLLAQASDTEVFWVRVEQEFTYKDIDRFCTTKNLPTRFLFGAEVVDGKVQAATFKYGHFEPLAEKLAFTSEELEGIELGFDSANRRWIKSIELNARQLNWIFTRGGGLEGCVPTQPLATLSPNRFTYAFDFSNIAVDPHLSSNFGKFSGKRKDGRLYQISLSLNERLVSP